MGTAIGQALLHAAKSSAGAFKEAVAYVGVEERQALEGAVRAAILRRSPPGSGVTDAGSGSSRVGRGSVGGPRMATRKLDLSQYRSRR